MAVVAVHPGGSNTYQPSVEATRNMQVDFSRNPKSFALNRWLYTIPVDKMIGLYTRMTVEEAGRLLNDGEDEWPIGEDAPDNKGRTEKHEFPAYTTRRRQFGYRIPGETADQATWDILAKHGRIIAQRCMTRRTQVACTKMQTAANWPASNTIDVSSIPGVTGKWDVSTTARTDIKRSIIYGLQTIQKQTLNAVRLSDIKLVIGPETASGMATSQEIVDFIKGSPDARNYIENKLGPNALYGLPQYLYGVEIVLEDAVKVTTRKGASSTTKDWVFDNDKPFLAYRAAGESGSDDNGLVGPENSNEAPTFSTLTAFVYEDMTVESKYDSDNRVNKGRIVDNYGMEITAPISGFLFTDVLT